MTKYTELARMHYMKEHNLTTTLVLRLRYIKETEEIEDEHIIDNLSVIFADNYYGEQLMLSDMYKAILFGIKLKAENIIFALFEKQNAEQCVHDITLHPHDSTNVGHVLLAFNQLRKEFPNMSNIDKSSSLFCLYNVAIPNNVSVHRLIYKNNKECYRVKYGNIED